jgi:hypothetical protein
MKEPDEYQRASERHGENCRAQRPRRVAALRELPGFFQQQGRHGQRDDAKDNEDVAPAEVLAEDAAERAADDLADHQRAHESRQRNLSILVGERVADVAERHRYHGRRGHAGEESQGRKDWNVRDKRAGERAERKDREARGHDANLADAIADRAVEQLEETVGQSVRRDDHRGRWRAGIEVPGDYMEQRVDDAGVSLDHERSHAEHEQGCASRRGGKERRRCFKLRSGHS